MKAIRICTVSVLTLLLFSACVPARQGQAQRQADLGELKLRLAEVEQGLAAVRSQAQPEDSRNMANLQAGLDSLRVELQSAAGRMDEVARENDRLKEELALLRDEFSVKVSAIESRLKSLEGGAVAKPAPASAPTQPATTVNGTVTPPVPATEAPAAAKGDPQSLYDASLELIQKDQNYSAGEKGMRNFLQRYSDHPLAVNAMYWVGEALYGQKKYEDAILQFQDVILQFGDHPKVAAALLKQAKAFETLGDMTSARTTLQKLIDRFPLSPEADKAKAQLKQ